MLATGLAITVVGNAAFWLVGRSHLPYGVFLVAMVIAGCGAGLLNGQTVKVLQGAVPEDRAGMASGLASTTRFIGILVSVAALGAILSDVARDRFAAGASKDLGRTRSSYFYAMEFVEGETLGHLINRSGRLEVKLALEIATQVAAGLTAVHEQSLVHRDIKPGNIMVRLKDDGSITAKIIDLGLAKAVSELSFQTATVAVSFKSAWLRW